MIDWSFEQIACDAFGANIKLLRTKCREREVVYARYLCYLYLTEVTGWSNRAIGERYAGAAHSSIIHGRNQARNWIFTKDSLFFPGYKYFKNNVEWPTVSYVDKEVLTEKEVETIQFMCHKGISYIDIAKFYGLNVNDVGEMVKDAKIWAYNRTPKATIKSIKDTYKKGKHSKKEIAAMHGVCPQTISRILNPRNNY